MLDSDDCSDQSIELGLDAFFPGQLNISTNIHKSCNHSCFSHHTTKFLKKRRSEFQGLDVNQNMIDVHLRARRNWAALTKKSRFYQDPWSNRDVMNRPVELVDRYRYNANDNTWAVDEIQVRMETESFASGALRCCYRLKKLSRFLENQPWTHPSSNCVAKRFIREDSDDPHRYEVDVILQMKAKIWASIYNRQAVVKKKVDIMQMCYIKFKHREGQPEYHLEGFICGDYVKYNSNSGYVDHSTDHCRNTPQAFSHFTFEWSNHNLIVVDIQGVGDVYTDPQIHTFDSKEYGDGNLGPRGMALFFYSHQCNSICKALELSEFELAPCERLMRKCEHSTRLSQGLSMTEARTVKGYGKFRAISESAAFPDSGFYSSSFTYDHFDEENQSTQLSQFNSYDSINGSSEFVPSDSPQSFDNRQQSHSSDTCCSPDQLHDFLSNYGYSGPRSSSFGRKICTGDCKNLSTLAEVHFALAELHRDGRFLDDKTTNKVEVEAIFFHMKIAADAEHVTANVVMFQIYFNLHSGFLPLEYEAFMASVFSVKEALKCMRRAAIHGDANMLIRYAGILDGTDSLLKLILKHWPDFELDWEKAVEYYNRWLQLDTDQFDVDSEPRYIVYSKLASLYERGGNGLELDLEKSYEYYIQAAESATEFGKGKLAMKFYEKAECLE